MAMDKRKQQRKQARELKKKNKCISFGGKIVKKSNKNEKALDIPKKITEKTKNRNKINTSEGQQEKKSKGGDGFKVTSSDKNARMAALQQFVDAQSSSRPAKKDKSAREESTELKPKEKTGKADSKNKAGKADDSKNKIKDEGRLAQLEEGKSADDKEINRLHRQLGSNKHAKNSNKAMGKLFGSDINSILDFGDMETCDMMSFMQEADMESDVDDDSESVDMGEESETEEDQDEALEDEGIEEEEMEQDSEDGVEYSDDEVQEESDSGEDEEERDCSEDNPADMLEQRTNYSQEDINSSEEVQDSEEFSANENDEDSDGYQESSGDSSSSSLREEEHQASKTSSKQDIYGRSLDQSGKVLEKCGEVGVGYVRPSNRGKDPLIKEKLGNDRFRKNKSIIRGAINRISGNTRMLARSSSEVYDVYNNNPTELVNYAFFELLCGHLDGAFPLPERQVLEQAALVAVVAARLGSEVGAHLLTDLTLHWHEALRHPTQHQLINLATCLAHLHTCGVVGGRYVYGVLNHLLDTPTEPNLAQITALVKVVGFPLRKEDPLAMGRLLLRVEGVEGAGELRELLTVVKNNNVYKMRSYSAELDASVQSLVLTLSQRPSLPPALHVSLEDLLQCETRGRWWVVGSAFSGAQLAPSSKAASNVAAAAQKSSDAHASGFSGEFLQIAKIMQFERPPHINILFVVESRKDAQEKIVAMDLPKSREKAIFEVITTCVRKIKEYTSFYSKLVINLCSQKPKYRLVVDRHLWDMLPEFDTFKPKQLKNLARFIVEIIHGRTVNLGVLKTLPFGRATPKMTAFMEDILLQIFDNGNRTLAETPFETLPQSKHLDVFRQHLKLYVEILILKKFKKGKITPVHRDFKDRVMYAMDLLSAENVPVL